MRTVLTTSALAIVLACACSGVPDIHYGDGGEATSSGASSGSSGTPPPPTPPDWACPSKPPPNGQGVCCGNRICLKCSASDCTKCEQEGCAGTLSAVCCKRNPQKMQCTSWDGC